jgi:hypothetical protein
MSIVRRAGFRFVLAYLALYSFPFPIGVIPGTSFLSNAYTKIWDALALWVGSHVLHVAITVTQDNGSGDRTFDYLQNFCVLVLAAIAALIWTVAAPRASDTRIYRALRVYVRYVLGFTLISYGTFKIIQTQFPFPRLARLVQPYGESSPMGLLWTFMGYSKPYNFFAGLAEAGGGCLLFFRRTTTLGGLTVFAVMLNVVMLNFCYDVPVKIYSMNLLMMAAFLVAPDLRRLANLLVLNRPTAPIDAAPLSQNRWLRTGAWALKALLIGVMLYSPTKQALDAEKQYGSKAPRPALYGIYDVEVYVRNGETLPPLTTDATRWRRVIFSAGSVSVKTMTDTPLFYRADFDPAKKTVTLHDAKDKNNNWTLAYARPDADHLTIEGLLAKEPVSARLLRVDESKFLLVNRGFHWINEFPFNR